MAFSVFVDPVAEVDLVGVIVLGEGDVEAEDGVRGGEGDVGEEGGGFVGVGLFHNYLLLI